MQDEQLAQLLEALPLLPGVYLMRDLRGRIVYVGKAKSLRHRVRQYFAPATADVREFVRGLKDRLSTIDCIVTNTEKEALLLEHNMIQRHLPRYNVRLTDGKQFLCLRLDPRAAWPHLETTRRPADDGAQYFGPYHSASAARQTLKLINRHFRLRSCADRAFAARTRPCLQHQIKRCFGPCVLEVDREMYAGQVEYVRLFLEGRRDDLLAALEREMRRAAEEMVYERAAVLRDQIAAVESTLATQRIVDFHDVDQDVVGFHREGGEVQIAVLEVIGGRLAGKDDYHFEDQEFPDAEILSSFLVQRYARALRVPDEVLLPVTLADAGTIAEILSDARKSGVRVLCPKRGQRLAQVRLAQLNARNSFEARRGDAQAAMQRLASAQRRLDLPALPRRVECVDIAHLGGSHTVGAIAAVVDGAVDRAAARTFKLRDAGGGDDFGAIAEVLKRRFTRAAAGEPGWAPPDLLVVDGGRGQLARAVAVLSDLGFADQPVVALAKERAGNEAASTDRIFLRGRANPLPLKAETSALYLLAVARDEAHRLANSYQGKLHRRSTIGSALDRVPGIGPKLRRALLTRLGSLARIREASEHELAEVPGIGPSLARRIKEALAGEK
jgi:excinuclease ABC subunit C